MPVVILGAESLFVAKCQSPSTSVTIQGTGHQEEQPPTALACKFVITAILALETDAVSTALPSKLQRITGPTRLEDRAT